MKRLSICLFGPGDGTSVQVDKYRDYIEFDSNENARFNPIFMDADMIGPIKNTIKRILYRKIELRVPSTKGFDEYFIFVPETQSITESDIFRQLLNGYAPKAKEEVRELEEKLAQAENEIKRLKEVISDCGNIMQGILSKRIDSMEH